MRVIFLDIDGVLNRRADWNRLYSLNDVCIRSFLAFAKKRRASVVLTSSWRNGFDVKVPENSSEPIKRLLKKLEAGGVSVTGKTPDLNRRRAAEIERYLYRHPEIDEYVIIDDDRSEFEKEIPGIWVTDCNRGFVNDRKIKFVRRR